MKLSDTTTFAMAVRGPTLFFTAGYAPGASGQNEFVYSMPTAGGAATQLTCCYGDPYAALAVDGTYVYFDAFQTTIHHAPIGPTPVESTKLADTPFTSAVSLFIDGASLYWVDMGASLGKVPLSGGAPTVVAQLPPEPATLNSFLVVSSGYVYWTDSSNPGPVRKVSVDGGKVTTIANRQNTPAGIAVDDQYVYWVNHNASGAVMRAPR